jgi:hypothetical protein
VLPVVCGSQAADRLWRSSSCAKADMPNQRRLDYLGMQKITAGPAPRAPRLSKSTVCSRVPKRIGVEHSLVVRTTECAALGARVAHGSNCEIARGTLLALGPLRSSWPLRSRWPPRACRTFLPFTAGETDRQQDNQRNRRCFHTRAPVHRAGLAVASPLFRYLETVLPYTIR